MAKKKKFTDDELAEYMRLFAGEPNMSAKIAELFGVSRQAINQRMTALEAKRAPFASAVVGATEANVYQVRAVLNRAYGRLEKLTAQLEQLGVDAAPQMIQAIEAARKLADTAVRTAEAWYRVEEVRAFMEDVLAILAQTDPALRDAVVRRIRERRGVREAFDSIV